MNDEMLTKAANASAVVAKEIKDEIAQRILHRYNANSDMLQRDFIEELEELAEAAEHYKRLESLVRPKARRVAKDTEK